MHNKKVFSQKSRQKKDQFIFARKCKYTFFNKDTEVKGKLVFPR